jgi:hypothetical protein
MKHFLIASVAALGLAAAAPQAHAVGCLSGGAMGALGGHMMGHGVLGAVGGCIAGHEWHKRQMREGDLRDRQDYVRERRRENPNYRDPWSED